MKQTVAWHPYPKEKPNVPTTVKESWGEYYATYTYLVTQKYADGSRHINVGSFFMGCFSESGVIAWAELPEPYKEEDDEDNT